jgi:CBS-domain-containing membrane protein
MDADAARRIAARSNVHQMPVILAGDLVGIVCECDLEWAPPESPVANVMRRPVVAVTLETGADDVADMMIERGEDCLCVVDSALRLKGVVTRLDLVRAGVLPNESGRDRCAACGSHHHLPPAGEGLLLAICWNCQNQAERNGPRDPYDTLGGSD